MELGAKLHSEVRQLQDTVKEPASTPTQVTAEKNIGVFPLRIDAAYNPDTEYVCIQSRHSRMEMSLRPIHLGKRFSA
eukprot:536917-Rhodomonas_salina.1